MYFDEQKNLLLILLKFIIKRLKMSETSERLKNNRGIMENGDSNYLVLNRHFMTYSNY